jgi:8-oxo-dGTP diphosphatase
VEKLLSVETIDWENWEPKEKAVLVFIVDQERKKVLLIHKKRGLGQGKINAPGGRIEPGESAVEAAIRECQEEVSLTPLNPQKRAELFFPFTSGYSIHGEVFFSDEWKGEMAESDEAKPFWCDLDKIPWEKMWEDDRLWLPPALAGKKLRGYYAFDEDKMISGKLVEVDNFAH